MPFYLQMSKNITQQQDMYVCMYVSMYLCIYVSMYVCMYVCMYFPFLFLISLDNSFHREKNVFIFTNPEKSNLHLYYL